jgi:hypothetical protein
MWGLFGRIRFRLRFRIRFRITVSALARIQCFFPFQLLYLLDNGPKKITSEVAQWLSTMQGTKTKSTSNIPWVSAFSDQRSVMSNTHVQTAPNMQFNAHLLSVAY